MKLKLFIFIGALASGAFVDTLRADDTPENKSRDGAVTPTVSRDLIGNPEQISKVIGMVIQDADGRNLVKIKDLAVDLQNGRIAEVIVATEKGTGLEKKEIALPPGRFSYDPGSKMLRLNLTRDQLQLAPAFDFAAWKSDMNTTAVRGVYQHYEMVPYFSDYDQSTENAPLTSPKKTPDIILPRLGYIARADKVIGATVRNLQDERIGKVENLVVDVPSGRIVEVIVGTGGVLGFGDDLSAVPAQAFQYEPARNRLRLDATRESLTHAPHFKSDNWPEMTDAKHVAEVYNSYGIPLYFTIPDPNGAGENGRDHSSSKLTPFDQGTSESDRAITARVRKEIMAHRELSLNAHNIKIITVNGQVTLRGPVNSEQEAATVIAIAKRAATRDSTVNSQLDINTSPNNN